MIKIRRIEKTEFDLHEMPTLFNEDRANKCFAIAENGIISYQFAWQSELINPIVLNIDKEIYCFGIDQSFCIADFSQHNILLNLKLTHYLYDVKKYQGWIFVISELEIIKININTYKIEEEYGLPDFFEKMHFENKSIKVKCLNIDQPIYFKL